MKITIWGCRGSLPTPGPDTLRYGGNTTCLTLESNDGRHFVIDAGSGIRALGKHMLKDKTAREICLMLTHSHWDHLMGFPFFTPAYLPGFTIKFCGGHQAQQSIQGFLVHQMEPPYFPVDFKVMKANFKLGCTGPCHGPTGKFSIDTIPLNHPNGGLGFKFVEDGRSFVFLTDNEIGHAHPGGLERKDYLAFCKGVDVLIHDAQYTDEEYKVTVGWGHSTYAAATDFAIEAGVKRFGIFHHDPDRTDGDLDRRVAWCRERIGSAGSAVDCFGVAEHMTIDI
jgi:phosphoribosyl 1,2-cyclic phosphodiesterase